MLPGPVFAVELLTTARRARYYALRAVYGLVLLAVFWVSYSEFESVTRQRRVIFGQNPGWAARGQWDLREEGFFNPGELAQFARQTFVWFAVAQGLAVLVLTPSLVAGTIAGEKQRKTLHYLLASTLTSTEIVVGKLLARLLMVLVYLVAGVPLLFLLMLFGGVEVELILITFGVTISFAVFLGCVSIFFSTILRQARSAITMTYMAMVACLLAPIVSWGVVLLWPDSMWWFPDAADAVNPLINVGQVVLLVQTGYLQTSIVRMVVVQWIYGVLLLVYSTRALRRIAANQSAKPKVILRLDNRGRASWRAIPRSAIGLDPMMWKERYSSRVGGVAKMLGLLNNIFWVVLIGCLTFEYAWTAIAELLSVSTWGPSAGRSREEFNRVLRDITPWVAGFWLMGTASTAAGSIASEREDDTWISLIATDLEGREILRAKMLGSILRFRWMGLTLLTVWSIGVIGGAVHVLGFLTAAVELAVFLWFAAALGVRFSLLSNSTSKALALTFGCLIFLNGGYLLFCLPTLTRSGELIHLMGVMPWLVYEGLFSTRDLAEFIAILGGRPSNDARPWGGHPLLPSVLGVLFYATAAAVLTGRTFSRFDRVVDRPRLDFEPGEAPASASWSRALNDR